LLHRLTGLGTLLFLAIHILDTATVYFFPSLYSHAIDVYRTTVFGIGEMALIFSVLFHGVNGLRIAFFDWYPQFWKIETERRWVIAGLAISILLWIPAAFIMGRNILIHNFGLFGG
jgi:succinate dehydrogenase / fumarate reductase cytochrome b subunit